MSITAAANTLVLTSSIAASLANITHIAIENVGGEFFRKAYTTRTIISTTKYQFTFFIDTSEGNTTITGVELEGNGATVALDSGTAMANAVLALTKTSAQSLTIVWTVELI